MEIFDRKTVRNRQFGGQEPFFVLMTIFFHLFRLDEIQRRIDEQKAREKAIEDEKNRIQAEEDEKIRKKQVCIYFTSKFTI